MLTVITLNKYYHAMQLKRNRIYYRYNKAKKHAKRYYHYKSMSLGLYSLKLKSINDVLKMLRGFDPQSDVTVDAYGNYTIDDFNNNKTKAGHFSNILGGMQL